MQIVSHRDSASKVFWTAVTLLLTCTSTVHSSLPTLDNPLERLLWEARDSVSDILHRLHQDHLNENLTPGAPSMARDTSGELVKIDVKAGSQAVSPHKSGTEEQFVEKRRPLNRRMHEDWLSGLQGNHKSRRRLAQAPVTGVQSFSAREICKSITCGGTCCDTLFTYDSSGNTTCTAPDTSCSADDQCQANANAAVSSCTGLKLDIYANPSGATAEPISDSVGYACPTGGDSACSFLNTFASDFTACTVGACLPADAGGLACVPVIRGIKNYGCVSAVQTFSGSGGAAVSNSGVTAAANLGGSTGISGR